MNEKWGINRYGIKFILQRLMNAVFLLPILLFHLLFSEKTYCNFAIDQQTSFTDASYDLYNHKNFVKLPEANKLIEINSIDYNLLNAAVFYATNQQRAKYKLKEFGFNPLLRDAASLQSQQMVKYNFFAHQNPNNNKLKTLKERLLQAGAEGKYTAAGENISEYFLLNYTPDRYYTIKVVNGSRMYVNPKTNKPIQSHTYISFGEAIVADWMTSPGHRANILNPKFTHLGCSGIKSTIGEGFPKAKVTQVFGALR